jgi:hypothetical protein
MWTMVTSCSASLVGKLLAQHLIFVLEPEFLRRLPVVLFARLQHLLPCPRVLLQGVVDLLLANAPGFQFLFQLFALPFDDEGRVMFVEDLIDEQPASGGGLVVGKVLGQVGV